MRYNIKGQWQPGHQCESFHWSIIYTKYSRSDYYINCLHCGSALSSHSTVVGLLNTGRDCKSKEIIQAWSPTPVTGFTNTHTHILPPRKKTGFNLRKRSQGLKLLEAKFSFLRNIISSSTCCTLMFTGIFLYLHCCSMYRHALRLSMTFNMMMMMMKRNVENCSYNYKAYIVLTKFLQPVNLAILTILTILSLFNPLHICCHSFSPTNHLLIENHKSLCIIPSLESTP